MLWEHANFDVSAEKLTFAIFSEPAGVERERIFEAAVAQLYLLRPELIVSVSNLIEGNRIKKISRNMLQER